MPQCDCLSGISEYEYSGTMAEQARYLAGTLAHTQHVRMEAQPNVATVFLYFHGRQDVDTLVMRMSAGCKMLKQTECCSYSGSN
mmetsp:Transcript_15742/g.43488  ORF Transcript_15742/g.43488 Transcript_15742/m.43488 type:complete len:84 (-) Transcript_15742:13-264(-)